MVNEHAEALRREEVAVGLRQAENLETLRAGAAATGHALGIHYSECDGVTETFRCTYIHSKVLAVDDRFHDRLGETSRIAAWASTASCMRRGGRRRAISASSARSVASA